MAGRMNVVPQGVKGARGLAPSVGVGISLTGVDEVVGALRDLSGRFATQETFLETTAQAILVEGETQIFNSWVPKYDSALMESVYGSVRSTGVRDYGLPAGSTRASLTQMAGTTGATPQMGEPVRFVTNHTLRFGSGNFYAAFQREIGGESGTTRGRKRVGPSLILAGNAENFERIMAAAAEYIFEPLVAAGE